MKKTAPSLTRRRFINSTAAAGSLVLIPGRFAFGKTMTPSPGDRINLAAIGIGNQGAYNIESLLSTGLCQLTALCDVDLLGKHTSEVIKAHPNVPRFTDFRKMFDRMEKDIDAVLIATPDHSHFCAAMLAMSLGKHIYVQKPLAHTFGQCERLMAMAERSGVVTQMGNQGHSGANYFQFKAWSEAGLIKDVTRVTAFMNKGRRWHGWGASALGFPEAPLPHGMDWDTWIDSAPVHPYSRRLHPQEWRSWFDYGSGALGDWGAHLLDTAHRFLKLGLPSSVTVVKRDGVNEWVYPQASTLAFDFPAREGMPPCRVTWYDGQENRPEVESELGTLTTDPKSGKETRKPVRLGGPGKIIYGKDLVFKGGSHGSPLQILPREKYMDMRKSLPRFPQKQSNHYANFLLACRGEEKARSPFSVAGPLSQVFNLGVIAQRMGGTLDFDRDRKQITNHETAQALLDPAPRKGWEEFYRM